MANKKRILILGAGLGGLSAAWHLRRKGIDCHVFEKETEVGGLCRSKRINGFVFDYDGHLLHFKHRYAFNLIKDLLGNNLSGHQRSAWVYFYGRYTRYPFQANFYNLPSPIIKKCLLGFINTLKNNPCKERKNLNFLDWINQTLGKGIARHFMIPYNTKFWTIPPQGLTCEWLDGFIPIPSLTQIIEGAVEENQRQFGYNSRFWYPKKGGINQVPLALASSIKDIYTNCKIVKIDLDKKEIKMASGNKDRFDYLISTIPLPEMPYLIEGLSKEVRSLFKKLKWNSILNLNLGISRKDRSRKHWIYFPQKEICFFRVGFFHNFSPYLVPEGKSSLYVEVSYSKNKPIDKNNIALHIKKDLKNVGIITSEDKICAQDMNDIEYGYPIYDRNYRDARERILRYLNRHNVISCGRYGSWRYMSMEDVILDGRDIAGNL